MDNNEKNKNNKELNFSFFVLVLTLLCSFIIVTATFTQLNVYALIDGHFQKFSYVPQIPAIMFIAGLLGRRYGIFSVIIYILTGLFFVPVFALGGGLDYILNINFGYILAYIPGIYIAGKIIANNNSLLRLTLADISGVLAIHLTGVLYLLAILLIKNNDLSDIFVWISNQTLHTLLIDLLFGLFGIITGNLIKEGLKKIA